MTKQIPLTKGYVALVDDENYDWLMQWKWRAQMKNRTVYVIRTSPRVNGKEKTILMHREILSPSSGMQTDHRDGDGLNNRRYNLREATNAQNNRNKRQLDGGASRFKGVCWEARREKWRALIMVNYKLNHLGYFDDELDAADAYNTAARELHGEFACLNIIPESEAA